MHLVLTGATGLVGSGVLDAMIRTKEISKISIISRRPVQMATDANDPSRINVILHSDFTTLDSSPDVLRQIRDAAGCVWAMGVSQTEVSKEDYVRITKDTALSAGRAFGNIARERNEPFNLVFVSGNGATFNPGMFTPIFGRVKGETELELSRMREENPLFRANSVRPAMVDPRGHEAISGYYPVQGPLKDVTRALMGPFVRTSWTSFWSPTEQMGRFLTEMAMGRWDDKLSGKGIEDVGKGGFKVVENMGWRRLMGLK